MFIICSSGWEYRGVWWFLFWRGMVERESFEFIREKVLRFYFIFVYGVF